MADNLSPYYSVGTATLTNGSADVTGQSSLWLSGQLRAGDRIESDAGEMATILTIDTDTAITLDKPFKGTSQTAAPYKIWRTTDAQFLMESARKAYSLLGAGGIQAFAGLTGAANKLPYFTGSNTMDLLDGVNLKALAALTSAADKLPYFTGDDTAALTALTALARTLLAGATGADMYGTLGVAPDASMPTRLGTGGASIPSNNYNLALDNGFYRGAGAGAVNGPPGSASFGNLLVFGLGGVRVQQIAAYYDQYYYRGTVDSGATWTAWDIFAPTKTTTSSGTTIRMPNRVQICTAHVAFGAETGSAFVNIFLGTEFRWTYPTAFDPAAGIPQTTGWVIGTGSRSWATGGGQTSPDYLGTPIQLASATANMTAGYIALTAIGTY